MTTQKTAPTKKAATVKKLTDKKSNVSRETKQQASFSIAEKKLSDIMQNDLQHCTDKVQKNQERVANKDLSKSSDLYKHDNYRKGIAETLRKYPDVIPYIAKHLKCQEDVKQITMTDSKNQKSVDETRKFSTYLLGLSSIPMSVACTLIHLYEHNNSSPLKYQDLQGKTNCLNNDSMTRNSLRALQLLGFIHDGNSNADKSAWIHSTKDWSGKLNKSDPRLTKELIQLCKIKRVEKLESASFQKFLNVK